MQTLFILSTIFLFANGQLGGLSETEDDKEIAAALDLALKTVNEGLHPASRFLRVVKVTSNKQVVAGINYQLTLHLHETPCFVYQLGPSQPSETECPSGKRLTDEPCAMTIWDQPWRGAERFRVTKNECVTTMANAKPLLNDYLGEGSFAAFEKTYKKSYETPEERSARFEIFKTNMVTAFKLQSLERGTAVYGPSIFADMTPDEFNVRRGLKLKQPVVVPEQPEPFQANPKIAGEGPMVKLPPGELPHDVPASWDWREHNAVTPVKNQGNCGSCWAFSTTGDIEGQWAIKKGQLVSLSEQELLDCDKVDQACNGGLMWDAYEEIIRIGGLEGEKDYPYETKEDNCHLDKSKFRAKVSGWTNVSSDEVEMARWLSKNGPIAIGINANAMQFYMGGVSHPPSVMCSPSGIDHGVLIIGYGRTWLFHTPYWIVKNSWGTGWGEKGYYRVYRGSGVCGLNTAATSAQV